MHDWRRWDQLLEFITVGDRQVVIQVYCSLDLQINKYGTFFGSIYGLVKHERITTGSTAKTQVSEEMGVVFNYFCQAVILLLPNSDVSICNDSELYTHIIYEYI